MVTPRMLASTGPLFAREVAWALDVIADAGYDGAELMVTQDPQTQRAEIVAAASEQVGLPVDVVHGPFLLVTRRVFGTDLVKKARRSLELAGALGSGLMIVHPPFRWQQDFHRWLLGPGDEEAAALGTRVGVENLYPVNVMGRPVRFHRYTTPKHLMPFKDVVLDTSHFGVSEVDIIQAWRTLAPVASHLHVSDYRGAGRDSHAPLGHGLLPLAGFLGEVAAAGFTGAITLELDCRRYLDDRAALVGYLRQERAKCLALLAGEPAEEVLGRPDVVSEAPSMDGDANQPTVGPAR
jgi:sugar phosphate isomerase/epimerase